MEEINKNSIDDLLIRYLAGSASQKELDEVKSWLDEDTENQAYFDKFKLIWQMSSEYQEYQDIDTESSLKNIKNRIDFNQKDTTKVRSLWLAVKIAAVMVIFIGFYFVFKSYESTETIPQFAKVESGLQKKMVNLPDGTIVTLNVNSTIEYPTEFTGKERKVKFTGEAYFEVEANKENPFIIETGKSKTKVVGTAFNLKAKSGELTHSVVVTEGVVEFSGLTKATKKPVRLVKGDKAVLNEELNKSKNADLNFMSWKTGVFFFENNNISEAFKSFSEYYQVKFQVEDVLVNKLTISGEYQNLSLSDLLDVLELSLEIEFEKVENTYLVKKKTN